VVTYGVIGTLQQLEGKAAGIVSWQTADDANSLGIDRMFEVVFECSFAGRSER